MAAKKKAPALLRSEVNARLEDLPLQIEALQSAMEEFGNDFKLKTATPLIAQLKRRPIAEKYAVEIEALYT